MRLSERFPQLTQAERDALASAVGTEPGYLWQLATRWRGKRASIQLMRKLAAADPLLTVDDMAAEFEATPTEVKAARSQEAA